MFNLPTCTYCVGTFCTWGVQKNGVCLKPVESRELSYKTNAHLNSEHHASSFLQSNVIYGQGTCPSFRFLSSVFVGCGSHCSAVPLTPSCQLNAWLSLVRVIHYGSQSTMR